MLPNRSFSKWQLSLAEWQLFSPLSALTFAVLELFTAPMLNLIPSHSSTPGNLQSWLCVHLCWYISGCFSRIVLPTHFGSILLQPCSGYPHVPSVVSSALHSSSSLLPLSITSGPTMTSKVCLSWVTSPFKKEGGGGVSEGMQGIPSHL